MDLQHDLNDATKIFKKLLSECIYYFGNTKKRTSN